jgi:hypothetical protein
MNIYGSLPTKLTIQIAAFSVVLGRGRVALGQAMTQLIIQPLNFFAASFAKIPRRVYRATVYHVWQA